MKKYKLSRLNKRAIFGTVQSVENPYNGAYITKFVPKFEVWCGTLTQSMDQVFGILGTSTTDIIVIVVRHDERIKNNLMVKLDEQAYSITNVNSDNQINSFDTVTLKVKKGLQ